MIQVGLWWYTVFTNQAMYFLSNRTDIGCGTPGGKWLPVKLSTEEQRKSLRECKQTENKLHIKWKNKDRKRYCKWNAASVKQKGKRLYEQEIIKATVRVDFVWWHWLKGIFDLKCRVDWISISFRCLKFICLFIPTEFSCSHYLKSCSALIG